MSQQRKRAQIRAARQQLKRLDNPPNPWHAAHVEYLGEAPEAELTLFEDASRSILAKNDSPDLPFTWSVNPYRGCAHACAYCYARPSHEFLDFGAGSDFERKILVKRKAPALLQKAFESKRWTGELIVFSGNTDCYQPIEASYELTRGCLEVCAKYRNPVAVITKSTLIERDIDVLQSLNEQTQCGVTVSVPFWSADNARIIEPYVPTPKRRVATIRRLAEAGLPVCVNVAPIIPGLSDEDIPAILEASAEAGARFASCILVRLPGPVEAVFKSRLRAGLPERAERILNQIRACRGGNLDDARFGHRMRGQSPRWAVIERLFETTCRRLGLTRPPAMSRETAFRRPGELTQLSLFD